MRIKIMRVIGVLTVITILSSGCMSSKKTGCVPEKSRSAQVKFKGFL